MSSRLWNHADVTDGDWFARRRQLTEAGVGGAAELGRFVNNTDFFPPSQFDERAAMTVLLQALPTLSDPHVVTAVAGHLRRPWARPAAFDALHHAFVQWARVDQNAGWALGDALATAATTAQLDHLLAISREADYGKARQMVVSSLGRYRKFPEVVAALLDLIEDDDVALHAMGALRRARPLGNLAAHRNG